MPPSLQPPAPEPATPCTRACTPLHPRQTGVGYPQLSAIIETLTLTLTLTLALTLTLTRQTGVGYPQLSAIIECADAAHGARRDTEPYPQPYP